MKAGSVFNSIFICFASLCLFQNCENENSLPYRLSGKIKGIDSGWIYVKHRQMMRIDSAEIKGGEFTITGESGTPEFCNIGTGSRGKREFYFGFFLQADT